MTEIARSKTSRVDPLLVNDTPLIGKGKLSVVALTALWTGVLYVVMLQPGAYWTAGILAWVALPPLGIGVALWTGNVLGRWLGSVVLVPAIALLAAAWNAWPTN